jgi:type VI protein secretion system component VasF
MVVSPGDERAYVDAAMWMLEDAARLGEMAEAARQTMLPRSWAGVVESFERVASEAMAGAA